MRLERLEWPLRRHWIDLAWGAFAIANLSAMLLYPTWETVPFHFIWVSLTLLYGFRVWKVNPTMWTLGCVMAATATFIAIDVARGYQPIDEITEVPLMAAMFLAMVWHARRRLASTEDMQRVSEANIRLLQRERQFLQDASHELRTPITIALGHIELVQRTTDDPVIADDAGIAVDELMRLRRLADGLLLLASADHPDFLRKAPAAIDTLVTDALHRWSATPRRWAIGTLTPTQVDVDLERVELAVDALIDNAVKHTDPGDRIELSATRDPTTASIVVSDQGAGIPPDYQAHLFDRFSRIDSSRNREAGGVGLGLAIVKAISAAHGGSVSVQSEVGKGSSFILTLPVSNGSHPPAQAVGAVHDLLPAVRTDRRIP
jgi:signal transduction histidine kinase